MKLSRRGFIQNSAASLAGLAAITNDPMNFSFLNSENIILNNYRGAVPIMQGLTTKSTSQFVILFENQQKLSFQVMNSTGQTFKLKTTDRQSRSHSNWSVEKLLITNLKLGEIYRFQVIDSYSGQIIDERLFTALDTTKKNPKVMIASCMKDNKDDKREIMWDNVALTAPDVCFLIGDTCYADRDNDGSDADYWRRYCETRSLLAHFRQRKLIPTLAVWDDHDFAENNADGTFAKKEMTRNLFKLFWDNEVQDSAITKGPGVSQIFTSFGFKFYFMDSRFFRSPKNTTNGLHWGREQEDFLFSNLNKSKTPSLIMNGSQFFGGYLQKDAFEFAQNKNFQDVCKRLSSAQAPVAFASGDVHFTEYMRIEPSVLGYETFEITSSSIHSTTYPFNHLRKENPRRIDANSSHQFTNLTMNVDSQLNWNIGAESFNYKMKKTLSHKMVVKR